MDDDSAKKKGLAALVIAMKPKGDGDKDPKDEAKEKDSGKGFGVAAKEAYSAMKDGDEAAFSKALKNAIKLCYAENEAKE
jgi:hypothetical protein